MVWGPPYRGQRSSPRQRGGPPPRPPRRGPRGRPLFVDFVFTSPQNRETPGRRGAPKLSPGTKGGPPPQKGKNRRENPLGENHIIEGFLKRGVFRGKGWGEPLWGESPGWGRGGDF